MLFARSHISGKRNAFALHMHKQTRHGRRGVTGASLLYTLQTSCLNLYDKLQLARFLLLYSIPV